MVRGGDLRRVYVNTGREWKAGSGYKGKEGKWS